MRNNLCFHSSWHPGVWGQPKMTTKWVGLSQVLFQGHRGEDLSNWEEFGVRREESRRDFLREGNIWSKVDGYIYSFSTEAGRKVDQAKEIENEGSGGRTGPLLCGERQAGRSVQPEHGVCCRITGIEKVRLCPVCVKVTARLLLLQCSVVSTGTHHVSRVRIPQCHSHSSLCELGQISRIFWA